jgi:ABC-type microcin C transport system duplicated ATPase subunit YejF
MMIEDALAEIADQVNAILDELGTDFRLEFQFEREIQRPARTCEACGEVFPESEKVKFCEQCGAERGREKSDELRPMVREGDRLQEFDQDSGAGRSILALATRVVLSRFLGATILFLDEVCSALDDYHLPFMIRLLRKLPAMGFRQVFVISHQKQIAEATPCNILVVRFPSEARSTVGWEEAVA